MSRALTTEFAAALSNPTVRPFLLFEGEFASGTVRFWTGLGNLTWDSKVWNGGAELIGMSPMDEVTGLAAAGATVSLSGIPADMRQIAIEEARQGKLGRAWFGLFDESNAVIPNPAQIFIGKLDVPNFKVDSTSIIIVISYENQAIDLDRPIGLRYTDQNQKAIYSNDRGFEFVAGLQDKTFDRGGP